MSDVAVFVPARLKSSRLPGKVLLDIAGLPMLTHVVRRCVIADVGRVFVATDNETIAEAMAGERVTVVMTSPEHPTGSDRLAEAARDIPEEIVINVQGDEAMVHPDDIQLMADLMTSSPDVSCGLLVTPMKDLTASDIKVATDLEGRVLYLSRADIPFYREHGGPGDVLKAYHVVGFRRDFLLAYARMPQTPLEKAEFNEYLRILEHGFDIHTARVAKCSVSVDTAEDLEVIRAKMETDEVYASYR